MYGALDPMDASGIAERDQWKAATDTMANLSWDITESFIRAGYNRDEAFTLTLHHLERISHDDRTD